MMKVVKTEILPRTDSYDIQYFSLPFILLVIKLQISLLVSMEEMEETAKGIMPEVHVHILLKIV